MHKLNRPTAPSCLDKYQHGLNNWGDVSSEDKAEIWLSLHHMQGSRCAYCECEIDMQDGAQDAHIEHFRQRGRYPQSTFDWDNLFGSCNRTDSCGKYKDKQTYNYSDLIKVDDEDPEDYLRFLPDGQMVPKDQLDANQQRRAEETIRVFNLNGALRQIRRIHVMGYLQTAEELAALAEDCDEADWQELLEEELRAVSGMPHETAIQHVLQFA